MTGYRQRFREAQIEAALRANHGNQSAAAKALEEATGVPVSRQSIFERVKTSARLRQVILELEEQVLDFAPDKLLQAIDAGDVNATKFLLATRGAQQARDEAAAVLAQARKFGRQHLVTAFLNREEVGGRSPENAQAERDLRLEQLRPIKPNWRESSFIYPTSRG
jgi:hypothetical protein